MDLPTRRRRQVVDRLWDEHVRVPFPPRWRGEEIAGVGMVLLDADVAACVSVWQREGSLPAETDFIARALRDDAARVLPLLTDDSEIGYLLRLHGTPRSARA